MLDILFPQTCQCCHQSFPKDQKICAECYDDIIYVAKWEYCLTCGFPFGFFREENGRHFTSESQLKAGLCGRCIKDYYSFDKARSIAIYEGSIRDLLISFKYEGKLNRAGSLLEIMINKFPDDFDEFDCVVPVPLHMDKLRKREYNQSVVLATGLANRKGVRCDLFGLKRVRDTRPQIELSNEVERRRNVRGAFSVVKEDNFKGRSVLVVDDVFTTGSTSDECSKMLLKSGAYKVQVLTLTRAKAM